MSQSWGTVLQSAELTNFLKSSVASSRVTAAAERAAIASATTEWAEPRAEALARGRPMRDTRQILYIWRTYLAVK